VFQAEYGIRGRNVTGVQTCALPICCRFCKGSGWIEILGCGMVHPHVLEMCGIDPNEYTGFAFGVGLERIALLKYEIDDMRLLYRSEERRVGIEICSQYMSDVCTEVN